MEALETELSSAEKEKLRMQQVTVSTTDQRQASPFNL